MTARVLIALLCISPQLHAAILTVCASGCNHATVQAAVDAAAPHDIIEIKSGETFSTGGITVNIGTGKRDLTLRSSNWAKLPPIGTRVFRHQDEPLMPTITSTTNTSIFTVLIDSKRRDISTVDTLTDTISWIQFQGSGGAWDEGSGIVCSGALLPVPLQNNVLYWVVNASGNTSKLSATLGGSPIDLTTDTFTSARCSQAHPHPPFNIRLQGLHITNTKTLGGAISPLGLGNVNRNGGVPQNITIEHCIIEVDDTSNFSLSNGQNGMLNLNGAFGVTIRDSWIGGSASNNDETKAVNSIGSIRLLLDNNTITAAGIPMFTGGAATGRTQADGELVTTDMVTRFNHHVKTPWYHYRQASGPPTGACYYQEHKGFTFHGAYYRDTSVATANCLGGGCYVCQPNGTWAEDTGIVFRNDSANLKGIYEFKECHNCQMVGELMEGQTQPSNDSNQMGCPEVQVNPVSQGDKYVRFLTVRDSWCKDVDSAIAFGSTAGFVDITRETSFISVQNILATGMSAWPRYQSFTPKSDLGRALNLNSRIQKQLSLSKMTFRLHDEANQSARWGTNVGAWSPVMPWVVEPTHLIFKNLIMFVGNRPSDAGFLFDLENANACISSGNNGFDKYFKMDSTPRFHNFIVYGDVSATHTPGITNCAPYIHSTIIPNVADVAAIGFVSATDHHLSPTSPYSAAHPTPTLLNDDGTDLGADVDRVMALTDGVASGIGPLHQQWSVNVDDRLVINSDGIGSTNAVLRYDAPTESACTVAVYTARARNKTANEHEDTNTVTEKTDTQRASTVWDGRRREVVFGAVVALTANTEYWGDLKCTVNGVLKVMPFEFRTKPAGSGGTIYSNGASAVLTHCTNAGMSSNCTTMAAAPQHSIVMDPKIPVRYLRRGAFGRVHVAVAP